MRYLSVCSGIEAATVAWHPLGWTPAAFSEIEPFPRAVLAHHYPEVPLHGDFTTIGADDYGAIDLLVGGTPCQSFSVAGLRGGMDDERGNLALEFLRLADRKRPRWLVWENVPGVLSSNGGRDFGSILGGLVELGYGFAYRVLDAQYFGVPQRRRRVFVVGYFGDARRAAAVLFERHSLSGHPTPRRKTRKDVAGTLGSRSTAGGGLGTDFEIDGGLTAVDRALTLNAGSSASDPDRVNYVAHSLRAEGFDASEDGTGRGTPIVPVVYQDSQFGVKEYDTVGTLRSGREPHHQMIAFALRGRDKGAQPEIHNDGSTAGSLRAASGGSSRDYIAFSCKDSGGDAGNVAPTLPAMHHDASHANAGGQIAVAFTNQVESPFLCETALPVTARNGDPGNVAVAFDTYNQSTNAVSQTLRDPNGTFGDALPATFNGSQVRRLSPVECERLQGFPETYTAVPYRGKPASDGPRYRALGNSMAVPCMEYIGRRIQMVEEIV